MDVFDFAMKMELDGKAWYEKQAAKTEHKALKNLLLEMARDEEAHYAIFKRLKEKAGTGEVGKTKVLESAKNIFEQMAEGGAGELGPTDIEAWKKLRQNEKDAEAFYRQKASEAYDETARKTLELIADEEHKHTVLIDNVIEFLDKPGIWLENAEWRHMEAY